MRKRKSAIAGSLSDKVFDAINLAVLCMITLLIAYPLYFTVIASISDPYEVVNGKVFLWPSGFFTDAYRYVLQEKQLWVGYKNTLIYTFLGTLFNMLLTIPAAYAISKKVLVGRRILSTYILIPMYFSGGLIPTYLQIKNLGLIDQPYTLIILNGLSIYNLIVTRVYFQTSIPEEIFESSIIDGASDIRQFVQMALPLAKPVLAVIALYYAVAHWNDYFTAMIYVTEQEYQPLQTALRNILLQNSNAMQAIMDGTTTDMDVLKDMAKRAYIAETMKYAMIFIASAPLLIAYPFVQKFFVQGMVLGSLKG